MTQRLEDHLPAILERVESAEALLLLLDFDGTLAPIAPTPEEAALPANTREILEELAAINDVDIAVITGRSITDARGKLGVPGLIYAGNHGLEIRGPGGLDYVQPEAGAMRPELHSVTVALAAALAGVDGVLVEDKDLTASVHYRLVSEADRDLVIRAVEQAVQRHDGRLRLTRGRKVLEIRPLVEWNKGAAAAWLRDRMNPQALPVCIGDDTTDEDAFRLLPEGITIKVGCNVETAAAYCAESVEEVSQFLRWIASTLRRRARHG